MSDSRRKFLLIDGHSLLHRAFHALPPLTTSAGEPTHAVYGFARMVQRLIQDENPGYMAVAFDKGKPTVRLAAFEAYKADRPPMPEELRVQVAWARELVRALGIALYEVEGYEADDVIGTLAKAGERRGLDVVIVTGDMDALQLVSERVQALITRRGIKELERFGPAEVRERFGVDPQRLPDLKGLTGDKSDNIPGVPGIGPKTAAQLLAEYGTLQRLLEHADQVPGRAGRLLRQYRKQALLSEALARIEQALPLAIDWERLAWRGPNRPALQALFRRLEFRRLLEEFERDRGDEEKRAARAQVVAPPSVPQVRRADQLAAVLSTWREEEPVALLPLFDGRLPHGAAWVGVAAASPRGALYIPVAQWGDQGGGSEAWRAVKALLAHPAARRVTYNVKVLHHFLAASGMKERGLIDDVMLAGYLVSGGQGESSLQALCAKFEVEAPHELERAKGEPLAALPEEAVARWAAARCRAVLDLAQRVYPRLEAEGMRPLYDEIELPLAAVLAEMERRGVCVDTRLLGELAAELRARLDQLQGEIFRLAGTEFNLNSPKQMARILYDELGLPVLARTKSGPSTSADVLEQLAGEHEIVQRILEYRMVQKLAGTYVDALPALVEPRTGRIHTTFNQAVTATGRLSSASPNLQNIPVRTPEGQRIRRAFVAQEGFTLIKADYSQVELRVLAHISGDEELIKAFRAGADIHRKTAADIYGVDPEDVTPAQRSAAKAINFGIVYGISSFGLARETGLSSAEAQAFIDAYFERYPGVQRYMKEVVARARERGYVTTIRGRRRYLPDLRSRRWAARSFAERAAINTPIQGSAADIIKAAMIAVTARLAQEGALCHLLLQVHDELLFEAAPDQAARLARLIQETMEGVERLQVPLVVDVTSGPTWLDQKPVG